MGVDFSRIYHSGFSHEYFDEGGQSYKSKLKYVQNYYEVYINVNQMLMEIFWTSFGISLLNAMVFPHSRHCNDLSNVTYKLPVHFGHNLFIAHL